MGPDRDDPSREYQRGNTVAALDPVGRSAVHRTGARAAGYLLVGDPAALPGINGILGELPDVDRYQTSGW